MCSGTIWRSVSPLCASAAAACKEAPAALYALALNLALEAAKMEGAGASSPRTSATEPAGATRSVTNRAPRALPAVPPTAKSSAATLGLRL